MPTPEQQAHRERLDARIKELAGKTQTMTPELKAEQTAWEKSVLDAEQGWRVIIPEKMTTAAGTTLTADAQGLIFAAGEAPRNEAYVIECKLPVDAAQGIRLEAVPNSKLPRGGPGRDPYGNFNITQIKLEIPDGTGWKAVAIQKIATDTGARSLDRKRGQLWTVDASREDQRLARQLVIVPENPITAREVRITLVQESEFSCQSVGYFRLSATGDSNPATVVGVSHSLRALLGKTGRTEDQEKKLADYFLTVAPRSSPRATNSSRPRRTRRSSTSPARSSCASGQPSSGLTTSSAFVEGSRPKPIRFTPMCRVRCRRSPKMLCRTAWASRVGW